jgi:tripartite-type tricarboxylate transporter receptor subunit TctC
MERRRFLHLAAGVAAFSAVPHSASAQAYPVRPVRLMVGFAAGGPADNISRLMGQWLTERLGQQVLIENRPGAGSNIAAEAVVRAPPDGYTLLQVTVSNAINASLYDKLGFDLTSDIAPVGGILRGAGVLEVTPSFPAKTVPEFIAYAKANPGKINVASAGVGSAPHLYAELFKKMAGVDFVIVHYRGSGPALPDVISGQLQAIFDPLTSSMGHIRAGSLRPLAVTTATRVPILPDLPSIAEFVPGYDASGWQGIGAPKNTPVDIIERLNREINAGLTDPKLQARFADLGAVVLPGSPADFGKRIVEEVEKWRALIRPLNIRME